MYILIGVSPWLRNGYCSVVLLPLPEEQPPFCPTVFSVKHDRFPMDLRLSFQKQNWRIVAKASSLSVILLTAVEALEML